MQPSGDYYPSGQDPFLANPMSFSEISIRHGFIRKVYSIVSLQMIVTSIIVALVYFVDSIKGFFIQNIWTLWLFLAGTFIIMIVLVCCESVARKHPINIILLFVFTILESFLLGVISCRYQTLTVFIALIITVIIVVGLTIFAFQTKIDFTGAGVYLFVFSLLLIGFGLICIIIRSHILQIFYSALGAGLFCFYLVFDTQLMLGGKHKYSISPEDYVLAALNLYIDIINLFLMILRLVGAARGD